MIKIVTLYGLFMYFTLCNNNYAEKLIIRQTFVRFKYCINWKYLIYQLKC